MIHQFIQINYPNPKLVGNKLIYTRNRSKRYKNTTDVLMELNMNDIDISYKELKSLIEGKE